VTRSDVGRKREVEERRVWELLTRDFYWCVPPDFNVRIWGRSEASAPVPERLQVFEITVAAIFAHLRPDFDWYVTPNRPDGGLDFVGQGRFLEDAELGIAAGITVGGQCKKRNRVKDIVAEISGSLARMATTINPTFFVVALSASLAQDRLTQARRILEDAHRRHCHILDRRQIEGLISDHLAVINPILRESLSDTEARGVLDYFERQRAEPSGGSIEVKAPAKVLAGVPFRTTLSLRYPLLKSSGTRLWWKPNADGPDDLTNPSVTLIGPVGADAEPGVECLANSVPDDPLSAQVSVEMVSYSVGRIDLGEVTIGRQTDLDADRAKKISLGIIQVVENIRPRFFERPFRPSLTKLSMEYDRALARGVNSIAVVGAGGSGKSRLCEEFSLEKRRRGCQVVQAKQTKTLDDPHRVLADLLIGLAAAGDPIGDPADGVIRAISQYDQNLADRSASAIRSIIGMHDTAPGTATDQEVLSSLLVLICARARSAPLIIHIQDLHWCTADVLLLLERLVWQMDMTYTSNGVSVNTSGRGTLFIFEGRVWESQRLGFKSWSTRTFEAFLEKLGCTTVNCTPFEPADSLEFVRRLFEDRFSARRLIDTSLLTLQASLAERIHHTAGGNPFHTLAQIQLLKERRVLGQNPETGLMYMIQPARDEPLLPDTVFDSIKLRWQYLKSRKPELATLLWGASLLEDRIPAQMFRHLWRGIGPDLTLAEIDATGFLWTGNVEQTEVSFRHENYFQSLRRLEVAPAEHKRVIDIYSDWFAGVEKLDVAGKFSWARILMQSPAPDAEKVRSLLRAALSGARRRGDTVLARRILTTLLNYAWTENARSPLRIPSFLKCCEDEIELCRSLLNSDRSQAALRIDLLRNRIRERLSTGGAWSPGTLEALHFQLLTAELLHSQILFNDRQPSHASDVAAEAVRDIRALSKAHSSEKGPDWQTLEMEALHSYAVALALGGEIESAIDIAEQAVGIARKSASPSLDVLSTYANILLAKEPEAAESILRDCLVRAGSAATARETQDAIAINLSMTLLLGAHRLMETDPSVARARLDEASALLKPVLSNSFRVGRYPDAGAAALLLGIISALSDGGEDVSWFAQAVVAAARGAQMETLWRAHINLATSLHRRSGRANEALRDHARAALEILEETLSPYPQPDRSARFELVRVPLAHAARFLVQMGDPQGFAALERYPSLRSCFQDPERGLLRQDRGGYRSHEWLNVGEWDYVIY
jgi:tetratricopeptide (TPR) repeat protein